MIMVECNIDVTPFVVHRLNWLSIEYNMRRIAACVTYCDNCKQY
jgi:hypothetical protein